MRTTYKEAGVDIAAGEEVVKRIKRSVRSTFTRNVLTDIGLFGAFFDAKFKGYTHPVLVSSVDGVGTKLKVAFMADRHDTVGQDLVNHCVNDILVCGATPLYFMDYFATGKLKPEITEKVLSGFIRACRENGCSLIGGETAEMPGFYSTDEYDIAGMIVGVVEKKHIIKGEHVKKGDVLIGLPSNGLHTNGYSLARSVLFEKYDVDSYVDELGATVGEVLLAVHRSYLRPVRKVFERYPVQALSHITGGGIIGNTSRVIPRALTLSIDWDAWKRPPIFTLIQRQGEVPEDDMRKTFNLGIGLVVIVRKAIVDEVLRLFRRCHEHPVVIGEVVQQK
ncbi:MAG: phosphoribosylformylglycinamidine cyclo-ligase [Bacteroidota bacterium]